MSIYLIKLDDIVERFYTGSRERLDPSELPIESQNDLEIYGIAVCEELEDGTLIRLDPERLRSVREPTEKP